jgi:hypothetical protein
VIFLENHTYNRQRYACHLRIGWKRLNALNQLLDQDSAQRLMTRFLHRQLSRETAYTPFVAGVADVTVHIDMLTDQPAIRAVVRVFVNVRPGDADALCRYVDDPKAEAVVIPRLGGSD